MQGIISLTVRWKSCPDTEKRFSLFDFIVIIAESPCSHSYVDENTITGELLLL